MSQIVAMRNAFDQIKPLTPYLSAYTRHAPQFHQWLQSQGQKPEPTSSDPWWKEFWAPPEYNPAWAEQYVVTGPDGKREWAPNTPPEVIAKSNAFLAWQRDRMTSLQTNPFEFFGPAIEKIARGQAEQIVREQLQAQTEQRSSQEFVQKNRSWLYECNQDGSIKQVQQFNPATGSYYAAPVLSRWGQAFGRYVQEVADQQQQRGYSDTAEQQKLATMMVERDFAIAQMGQGAVPPAAAPNGVPPAPTQTPQQAANNDFLRRNNPPAAQPPANGNPRFQDPAYPKSIAELESMALQQMAALGIK